QRLAEQHKTDGRTDPQFLMLLAIAYDNAGRTEQAEACLEQAADHLKLLRESGDTTLAGEAGNAIYVVRLGGLFDALGQYDRARKLYADAVELEEQPAPALRRMLALRRWQAGEIERALAGLEDVDITSTVGDPALLGTKAMLLLEAGQQEPGKQAVATLESIATEARDDVARERTALAWSEALRATYLATDGETAMPVPQRIALLTDALGRVSGDTMRDGAAVLAAPQGVFLNWIGDIFASVGETELAVRQWQAAGQAMPGWFVPWHSMAEAQLVAGQLYEAQASAREAALRATGEQTDTAIELLTTIAYRRWLDAPSAAEADYAAASAARHQRLQPLAESTLPIHVHFTALSDPDAARRLT
ncbi:MAG: hypothetical protein AAGK78_15285, partial [Planctomycetota bacterium]